MREVSDAISYATLNLTSIPAMMFKLSADYTGTVTISYNGTTSTFEVVSGLVAGKAYISIALPVEALCEAITITTANGTAEYSFNAYATAINSGNTKLSNVIFWLYNYAEAAKAYATANKF